MKQRRTRSCIIPMIMLFIIFTFQVVVLGDVSSSINVSTSADDETFDIPDITVGGAVVVDLNTGYTLYEKNIYEQYYPASITKIMTAILSLENLNLSDTVTFSHDAVFTIEPGSSSGYLDEDEQITVEQCLYGLMLISGNDLANGLAEKVEGSMDGFAIKMTERAKELGAKNTNFTNAHGLTDVKHYTCVYDMALMGKYAFDNFEMYRTLISTVRYVVPPTNKQSETRYWRNSNRMILEGEDYYYPDCLGGKTGFTNEAGGTLVTYHTINGRNIMVVIMKGINTGDAYANTVKICDYLKENVNNTYFEKLDKRYNDLMEKDKEELAVVSNNEKSNSNNIISPNEKKEASFPFPVKIILFLVVIFIIYYFYISYQRSKKRKRPRRY